MKRLNSQAVFSLMGTFDKYPDISSLAENVVKELINSLGLADAGIIYLYDEDIRQLVPKASCGYPRFSDTCKIAVNEGLPGQCLALRQPFFLSSVDTVREYMALLKPKSLDCYNRMRQGLPPAHGCVAIPLWTKDITLGVLLLEHHGDSVSKFTKTDKSIYNVLGDYISLMLENHRLNEKLKDSKRSYRKLLGKFLASSEDERKRISREIHDDINHILLSIKLNLEDLEISLPPRMEKAREKLKVLYSHVSKAFDDLHRLSLDLRPPGLDESGLPQTLKWYTQILSTEAGLPIKTEIKGLKQRRTAPVVETELLRITQEALSNILKHAHAKSIRVKLTFGESNLVLEVEDDGIGFDVEKTPDTRGISKKLGILGMRERAERCGGDLKIRSVPGCGTKIKTTIPIGTYDWGVY